MIEFIIGAIVVGHIIVNIVGTAIGNVVIVITIGVIVIGNPL